ANYMSKGSLIGVDGRIQTRSYDGQDGKRVYVTEVVADTVQFLESRNSNRGTSAGSGEQGSGSNPFEQHQNQQQMPSQNQFNQQSNVSENLEPIDISDDDLPF
ncbi:MAG: single-stranded DNA-binding protein, partial [Amphibacillus sp.]|nr:single-stranded DNA-binding protein [Amphibacillus sp.]